ncbi:MAG: class I SAM-dependent RNA methyltransferase [Bacilli bacterium]|nr:class I SAM-dependent RNA methyltransferase [Bacilli bacterium]
MVKVKIERLNDQLEGVGNINGKIVFVPKAKVGEEVEVNITLENSKYLRGEVISNITSDCPYFNKCGGCFLRNYFYEESLKIKEENIKNLFNKNKLDVPSFNVIKNPNPYNYRNKISLKVVNKKIGFYQDKSNDLVEVSNCLIAKDAINKLLPELNKIGISNGFIIVRCNYNDELLIIIDTDDKIDYDFAKLKDNHKIAGVIINKRCVLNNDYFFDKINNHLFKVSYNSFFQVNNLVAGEIFNIIENNIDENDEVLDLYSGVGTLSITAANKAKHVIGVEMVPNAVKNALINKDVNKINNVDFMLGDVPKVISNIKNNIDTIIFDPPRKGLDTFTINYTLNKLPNKIIYVSCNPITLVRDLKLLNDKYIIKEVNILDMFSYSYHAETVCILERKN